MNIYEDQFDLEDFLAADSEGNNLRHVQDELREGLQNLRREIDKGLPPEEFKKADGLKQAFETALKVNETVWENYNNK